ncbi:hypothetical protein [Cyanobium sp. WAJ14-Wanaka]|uniref:hypothetical protein n=1 Tax=Cyanobium sp. WAJ14-Wanaka TaxID=2823725 RepID=UPI0020CCBA1B|nr:hypothetical protein [Cyanobium sp. WAJ14-Wanaka]MCP9775421.1 hypothetical protein [Cyanobium sp. WAJ14-Wanaka]
MPIAKTPPRSRWQGPLLVGLCFGLGYGITQRLLSLQLPAFVQLGEGFELRQFPGASLDSLRLRFGAEPQQLKEVQDPQPQEVQQPAAEIPLDPDPLAAPQGGDVPQSGVAPQSGVGSANLDGAPPDSVPPAPKLPAPQLPPPASIPQP